MRVVFFSFYYPPDLCAGSFRAVALVRALKQRLAERDELHVITTHPNRYSEYRVGAKDIELDGKVTIHRITVPTHQSGMLGQSRSFMVYARAALWQCRKLRPDYILGSTSRLMTGNPDIQGIDATWGYLVLPLITRNPRIQYIDAALGMASKIS